MAFFRYIELMHFSYIHSGSPCLLSLSLKISRLILPGWLVLLYTESTVDNDTLS